MKISFCKNPIVFSLPLIFSLLITFSCGSEDIVSLERDSLPANHKKITVRITDYCPEDNKEYVDFYAVNRSARIRDGELRIDFDREGLVNIYDNDEELNINPFKADSNGDGYGDFLIHLSGINRENQTHLKICEDPTQDTDLDGLTDCEENNLLHTHPQYFDTDHDGIPDELEVRNNMNPSDPNDAFQDIDGDMLSNSDEIKLNTPIDVSNTRSINSLAYRYDIQTEIREGRSCYDMTVFNIPLVKVSNGNLIRIYLIEKISDLDMNMRTFRILVDHDKYEDDDVLEFTLDSLKEGA